MHSGTQSGANTTPQGRQTTPPLQSKGERVADQFRLLFQAELMNSTQSVDTIAKKLGMTSRNLQRIIYGQQKLTAANLVEIGDALSIDKARATVAVERFQDYRMYYDAALTIAVNLIKPVVEMINHHATTSLEPLHPKAAAELANRVGETVIMNQVQLCARREKLDNSKQD